MAVIKLKNPEVMVCARATIWPACLPVKGVNHHDDAGDNYCDKELLQ